MRSLEDQVRDRIRELGLDPGTDGAAIEVLVEDAIDAHDRRRISTLRPGIEDRDALRKLILDGITGLGALQPLLEDPAVEEIWINAPGRVFCARDGRHQLTNVVLDDATVRSLVEKMLRASGRRLDLSSPFVDATLTDGSRLHVVIPDVTRRHWAVNIRKFVVGAHHLNELVRRQSLSAGCARFLGSAVAAGWNVVVSGATQAGKTTMLNCLAAAIPPGERVITCEEVFELQIDLADVVPMQTRQANLEGRGAIDLRRLIVEALRMRPDRIIVGEVRQHEAFDLLVALNSGLPGMTSIHANSATEALAKLATLPLLAGENVSHSFVVPTVARSIDLLVHLERSGGRRRVAEVVAPTGRTEGDRIESVSLFRRFDGELRPTGMPPPDKGKAFPGIGGGGLS